MLLVWYLAYRGPVCNNIYCISNLVTSSLFEIYQLVLINQKKTFVIPLKTVSQALAHFGIAILIIEQPVLLF